MAWAGLDEGMGGGSYRRVSAHQNILKREKRVTEPEASSKDGSLVSLAITIIVAFDNAYSRSGNDNGA